jgi:hypothetical protein
MYDYLPCRQQCPDMDSPSNWIFLRDDLASLVRNYHLAFVPMNLDGHKKRFHASIISWVYEIDQPSLHNAPCKFSPCIPPFLYARFARTIYGIAGGTIEDIRDLREDINWMASPRKGAWEPVEWRKERWYWVGGDRVDDFDHETDMESGSDMEYESDIDSGSEVYEIEPMSD